jgi:DNA-binding NarL/FixJ family response regulator
MIRVLIVDDHELLRAGLRSRLEREPGIAVVGEADTAERALLIARRLQPDLIVLDLLLPRKSGDDVIPDLGERRAAGEGPRRLFAGVAELGAPGAVRRCGGIPSEALVRP